MSDLTHMYIEGIGRNPGEELGRSHLYQIDGKNLKPMCEWAWNRSDGESFSIFRGRSGARGLCEICRKRAAANKPGMDQAKGHKTKWI